MDPEKTCLMPIFVVELVMCLFRFRGNNKVREAIHAAFLYHAVNNGLTMGIVNPNLLEIYDDVPKDLLTKIEDVLLNRHDDAVDALLEFAESITNTEKTEVKIDEWRLKPVAETN